MFISGTSDNTTEWGLSGGTRIERFIPEGIPGMQVHNELQSPLNWDYYVVQGSGTTTTQDAAAGQLGQGGKGGSGKNGGGGGGSGYFGGGGGGSAVHSSGGGGSSYVSFDAVLYLEQVSHHSCSNAHPYVCTILLIACPGFLHPSGPHDTRCELRWCYNQMDPTSQYCLDY